MREQMKALDDFEMGDLWGQAKRRVPGPEEPEPPTRSRLARPAIMLVASIVVIGLVLFGLRALGAPKPGSAVGPGDIVRYHLDGPPQPISVGEGAAWVKIASGSETTNGIVRIDAQSGEQQMLDTPGGDWTAVGGGYAWLICNSAECIASAQHQMDPFDIRTSLVAGSVIRMDPTTGKILGYTPLFGRGIQIVGVPDGVWVSTAVGVYFVNPDGSWTKHFALKGANLIGSDQTSVWISGGGSLVSLDPQSGEQRARVPFQDPCTMEVAAGMVWAASCRGQDHLMGVDSTTGNVLFDRLIQGYGQMRYANGVLWLAQRDPSDQNSIQLVAMDPRTGEQLEAPIQVPSASDPGRFTTMTIVPPHVFFAVGEGSFWLTDFGAGEVIRMRIPTIPASPEPQNSASPRASEPLATSSNYVLSDFQVGPSTDHSGNVIPGSADVTGTQHWSTDAFPGEHQCSITVSDASGRQIGTSDFRLMNMPSSRRSQMPVEVNGSIDGASATGSCDPTRLDNAVAYSTSVTTFTQTNGGIDVDYHVTQPAVVAPWQEISLQACTAAAWDGNGILATSHFQLSVPDGNYSTGIDMGASAVQHVTKATVTCGPFAHDSSFPEPSGTVS